MIEADSVLSTPPLSSSSSKVVSLFGRKTTPPSGPPLGNSPEPAGGTSAAIVKFPYDACRRIHSRKPRRSKNGTPEERAAKAAQQEPIEAVPCARGLASRKRNPLRHYHSQAAIAVTVAGKLHRGEALRIEHHINEIAWLRRGAEAARLLADELARLVEEEG
jgi:hypothetical protein